MIKKTSRTSADSTDSLVRELIDALGEDTNRDGLIETPKRVVKMYKELFSGYGQNEKDVFKLFKSNGYGEIVTVSNIEFHSLCEHHMIPFFGKVHIGYVPNGQLLGLSKFSRLVQMYSKRLQTQENLTNQIADSLQRNLHPKGLIVHIEAEHLCVAMRGIKQQGVVTKTTVKKGVLAVDQILIQQFYQDISSDKKYDRI